MDLLRVTDLRQDFCRAFWAVLLAAFLLFVPATPQGQAQQLPIIPLAPPEEVFDPLTRRWVDPELEGIKLLQGELASATLMAGLDIGTTQADLDEMSKMVTAGFLAAEDRVTAAVPPHSRAMASWLSETLVLAETVLGRDAARERAARAVAIERQMAVNSFVFGNYPKGNALAQAVGSAVPERRKAIEWVMSSATIERENGQIRAAEELAELGFVWAQSVLQGGSARAMTRGLRDQAEVARMDRMSQAMAAVMIARLSAFSDADLVAAKEQLIAADLAAFAAMDTANLLLPRLLTVAEVQALLQPEQALVMAVPGHHLYNVFVLTQDAFHWHQTTLFWVDVDDLATEMLTQIGAWNSRGAIPLTSAAPTKPQIFGAAAYQLYQALLAPAEPVLIDRQELLILPLGGIAHLPWSMMLREDPAGGTDYAQMHWLIRDFALVSLPSPESLSLPAPAAREDLRYLGFADPLYSAGAGGWIQDTSARVVPELSSLPETGAEVEAVSRLYSGEGRQIYAGELAQESALMALAETGDLSQFDILHFATHGLLWGDHEEVRESILALSTNEAEPASADWTGIISLAASVADGALGESEIRRLPLNAALVILSACKTAATQSHEKDGLSGLAGAFLHAGAKRVLATHWPVNSQAAVEIVTQMMHQDPTLADPANALRQSILRSIARGGQRADPSWWAAFSLIGQP